MTDIRDEVRARYAEAATSATAGSTDAAAFEDCCGPDCCGDTIQFGSKLYADLEQKDLPDTALLASLGCGNPTAVAELEEGETVLDLGSGGGIDVLLSAKRVGPTGKAYGLDMTDEMLALAEKNRAEAGATNVEFLKGFIEDVPLPDAAVDVVISNCVINLSSDKPAVFDEMHRVLRAGGRLGITDVVANDELTPEQRAERGSYVGCIAGALSFAEYETELARSGFEQIAITKSHEVADGMWSAIVTATKPL
ncbi:MAG: arsenite methyltransferase [Actinomycetota bacterium]